jgi:two-component system, sensor histidine kinase and response regulator
MEMVKTFETSRVVLKHKSTLKDVEETDGQKQDVILLDLSLPDASGMELLQKIREKFSATPVIILTGLNDVEMIRNAAGQGVQDYLVKSSVDSTLLERSVLYAIWRSKYMDQRVETETALREKAKLQQINARLESTLHQLEKSNSRLEEFAYVATHNLRAPMVNLTSLVALYEESGRKDGELFEKIHFTTDQMNNTLNDLINLVMVNRPATDKEEVELEQLVRTVAGSIGGLLNEAHAKLETDFSRAPSIVYPASHLVSIVQNLLTNAIKYRSPERMLEVKVTSFPSGQYTCLSVSDNGIGIDLPRYGNKLFKAFQRLHVDGRGKGLGLYIIRSQVESLGGKVEVESVPGEGSEFKVYLKNNPDI